MRRGKLRVWALVAVVLILGFIWGNSLLDGEDSSEISGGLLAWLISVLPFLSWLPEVVLRKLGHFSEFTALGFFLCWLLRSDEQRGLQKISLPLLCGILVANIDETIQVFRPGRSSSVVDVWIDAAGTCTGIGLFCLLCYVVSRRKKKTCINR